MSHTVHTPIRVGLIGLGRTSGTMSPGLWGSMVHLPYLLASPKYQLTAVCNSTIESAQASLDYHKLGPTVKAYCNASDLAQDPNVDMIIVSVKVTQHYALTKPALLAGKDVFVEWPIASTTAEAKELTALAKSNNCKTIVGLQARASPWVLNLQSLISSGRIGTVTSTIVTGTFGGLPAGIWPAGAEYFLQNSSGGTQLTIFFGHFLDSFIRILGGFKDDFTSSLRRDIKTLNIINTSTGQIMHQDFEKTSPDHVQISGTLESGASASIVYYTVQGGGKAVDELGLRWVITGTEGQIEITAEEGQWQMGMPGLRIRGRFGGGEVEEVEFESYGVGSGGGGKGNGGGQDGKEKEEDKVVDEMPGQAKNTARVYEAFAEGRKEVYADFESAVQTHEVLDQILERAGW